MSLIFSSQKNNSPPKSDGIGIAMVGNPGTGKSTLLNGLVGRSVFKSGISFGTGLTTVLQEHKEGNVSFFDTPGLNDIEKRKAAGEELDKLLKNNRALKLIFVVTVLNGRVSPEDTTTISVVLDAITSCDTNDRFAVVLNQASPAFLKHITNDALIESKIRSQITGKRHTSHWCYIPNDSELVDKSDGMLFAPQLAQLLAFMPETRPVGANVTKVDTASYEEKLALEVRAFEEKEEALRQEINLQKLQIEQTENNMNRMEKNFNKERESMRQNQQAAEKAIDKLHDKVENQREEARLARHREKDVQDELLRVRRQAQSEHQEARSALGEMRSELQRVRQELQEEQNRPITTVAPARIQRMVAAPVKDTIRIGQAISPGQNIVSKTGRFKLRHRTNSDVAIIDHFKPRGFQTIWTANTDHTNSKMLLLDDDGVFKLMNEDGSKVWSPNSERNSATHGVMQNDGNFVLYSSEGPVWSSNSWQHGWSHND